MAPRDRGGRAGWPRRPADRRATWRSVVAGFVPLAVVFAAIVAVTHPTATAVALSLAGGMYGLHALRRRSAVDRTLQLCGPRVCLQLRLRLG